MNKIKLEMFENLRTQESDLISKFRTLVQARNNIQAFINQNPEGDHEKLSTALANMNTYLIPNYDNPLEYVQDIIKTLTESCKHEDVKYDGHDSHYDYEKCIYCLEVFKC